MPELDLDSIELKCLQTLLRRSDIEIPDDEDIPDPEEWIDPDQPGHDHEAYPHEFGAEKALIKIDQACSICGDTECDRGVAYVGSTPIHADRHPEAKAERAWEEHGRL